MMFDITKAEIAYTAFMKALWLDLNDPSMKDTPRRVSKMFTQETCKGLYMDFPKITTFPNTNEYWWMVVVKDITVQSICAHHFQNFDGVCHIAYIPKDKIIGLSKFSRIVDYYARRPQTQEFLIKSIFDKLQEILETKDIAISMNAVHNCMKVRWVREPNCSTSTALVGWIFQHSEATRNEFFNHINNK